MERQAFVTLVTSDDYAIGAIVLAHSLRATGTRRRIAVMVTPTVSDAARQELRNVFHDVHPVELLDSKDVERLRLLRRPELGVTFTKLCLWTLPYDKVVFMDADTLALKNIDELFEEPELSAAPDVGWPDCFNSGVFVAVPSQATYDALLRRVQVEGSFDGGDQGILNQHFPNWNRLPFLYNVTPGSFYTYAPAFRHHFRNMKVIHYIGDLKPWKVGRPTSGTGDAGAMLAYWWTVHDAHRGGHHGAGGASSAAARMQELHIGGHHASHHYHQQQQHGRHIPPPPSQWERAVANMRREADLVTGDLIAQLHFHDVPVEELQQRVDAAKNAGERDALLTDVLRELRLINERIKLDQSRGGSSDGLHSRAQHLTTFLRRNNVG